MRADLFALGPPPVYVFPITGGPCAGKTTALAHLLEQDAVLFPDYSVAVVPEAATLYHQYDGRLPFGRPASCCGGDSADYRNLLWELLLNELKRTLETRTVNAALAGPRPSIVLCDRGIFDSRAYLPTARDWYDMLDLVGWQEDALARRYDHGGRSPATSLPGRGHARLVRTHHAASSREPHS